ncbi:MAG: exodeoxyribonuclease V subunit beta [Pseudomonadales bacterium]
MKPLVADTFPLEGMQLIEASAGTGKTYTITNLYLRLLLGHSKSLNRPLAVNEILVLTFTIAATEELRHRIRSRIVATRLAFIVEESEDPFLKFLLDASEDRKRDRRLLAAAIQLMDEAAIYTIHGFCARVLKEQSFDTGMLFDQNMDADKERLLALACEDCFRQEILSLRDFDRRQALDIWPNPQVLQSRIRSLLVRDNLVLLPEAHEVNSKQVKLIATMIKAKALWLESDLATVLKDAGLKANTNSFKKLDEMNEFCGQEGIPDPLSPLWEHWSSEKLNKNLKAGNAAPEHPCLDLIEAIYQSRDVVDEIRSALWQTMFNRVRLNMNKMKQDANQLTLDDLLTQLNRAVTSNEKFASELSKLYPCALVDEFQDTDDIQYGIFDAIYNRPGEQSLLLIGDPKQAIYQFRGADVFTYINAKRACGNNVYSLETNWRSSPALIDAVNHLFDKHSIFDNDIDMPFLAVKAPEKGTDGIEASGLLLDGTLQRPFSLFLTGEGEKAINKDDARMLAMNHAAEEVSRILTLSARGKATICDSPVNAGQIAFLVRSRVDANAVQLALRARNIKSVYLTQDSVFLENTAKDLGLVLQGIIDFNSHRASKAALATNLLQCTVSEIQALNVDSLLQQKLSEEFLDYHKIWSSRGIAPMIEKLIVNRKIADKWLGQADGERQITNLRHLAELLQQRSTVTPGMHRLLNWFLREISGAETGAGEQRQLRLESDENLVKIVTMHAAKGLEYDIVYIPFGAFYKALGKKEPGLFHREMQSGFEACLELGEDKAHKQQAQREILAEDMRLLYVAITRAKFYCCLGIPKIRDLPKSALARLLDIESAKTSSAEILQRLSILPAALFQLDCVLTPDVTIFTNDATVATMARLVPPHAPPAINDSWRLHSYTGVTYLIAKHSQSDEQSIHHSYSDRPDHTIPGFIDDDVGENSGSSTISLSQSADRFSFPRGARIGIALHSLMEDLDFRSDEEERKYRCQCCLNKIGIIEDQDIWLPVLLQWLDDILGTPLIQASARETPLPFCLADISRKDRIDELEFHFPLNANAQFLDELKKEGYLKSADHLTVARLEGMMTGLIDLVVRHENCYYLIDYKSNHLGNSVDCYDQPALLQAIEDHQYDLQYLIYCVALNRYLTQRIPDYDYDKQFGGVMYLFLRGMNGQEESGVYHDKPSRQLIQAFDLALGISS